MLFFILGLLAGCDGGAVKLGDSGVTGTGTVTGTVSDDADGDGILTPDDCDDADASIGASTAWYADADADGFGDLAGATTACTAPVGSVADATDCDDTNPDVHPGATESDCADPTDYDCDGTTVYADADADGSAACLDCDDADATDHPGADELCGGGDEDCDGLLDDEDVVASPTVWYRDWDEDGYADEAALTLSQCAPPEGYTDALGDCDAYDPARSPGLPEVCDDDDLDEDCDELADDADASADPATWTEFFADDDGDGFGDEGLAVDACDPLPGYVADSTDCADDDDTVHPGAAEYCDDLDSDCDGLADVDDAVIDGADWYLDVDGDGYGDPAATASSCVAPAGYVDNGHDCDDLSSERNPGATETCDGADQDCDGAIDEDGAAGAPTWYADVDGDGYAGASPSVESCAQPTGYLADPTDCDDGDAAAHPGAAEVCDAEDRDEDCDGVADSADNSATGFSTWYLDADLDDHGAATATTTACDRPSGYAATATDCDDGNAAVNPDATEQCDTLGIDEDCDGSAGEPDTWYADADGDGFGDAGSPATLCAASAGYVTDASDCDDGDAAVNPAATEVCDTADTDEDCDGAADDGTATGTSTWYADADGDGFGDASFPVSGCSAPAGYVADGTDCDDTDASATTTCGSASSYTVCASGGATYTDLQDAIDHASDGDVITVCAGTYGYVELSRAELVIQGEDAETTIIEGGSSTPALTLNDSTLELSGVTLTGSGSDRTYPAIYMSGGTLNIHDARVADVVGTGNAIAMEILGADTTWDNVIFENNTMSDRLLEIGSGGSFTMTHCVFRDNTGTALNLAAADAEVANNLFTGNSESGGIPVYIGNGTSYTVWVYNNVFYGNSGTSALYLSTGVDFENNIVSHNIGDGITGWTTSANYNAAWDNTGDEIDGVSGTGNIQSDPRFVDAAGGDFSLDMGFSPCVDAGNPLSGYNDVDGSRNDMGIHGGPQGSW